jgi:hypothetical protein
MTDENMHDGPRIKNALKGGHFSDELTGPHTPSEVRERLVSWNGLLNLLRYSYSLRSQEDVHRAVSRT